MQSFTAAPLTVDGKTIGVLSFARKRPGHLMPIEVQMLRSLTHACALAMKNARIREIEREMLHRSQVVRDILMALDAGQPLIPLLRMLVARACDLTGARYGAMGVLDPSGHALRDFITVGFPEEISRKIEHLPEGKGLLGSVIQSKRPIRVKVLARDPRSSRFPAHHPQMTSFLGVPLRVGHTLLGNFYLTDKHGGIVFSAED